MERLFEFFYTKTYTMPASTSAATSLNHYSQENPFVVHANVRLVAEFYDIPELQAHAMNNFAMLAQRLDSLDAEMFTNLVQRIYHHTSEEHIPLFDTALAMAFRHKKDLLGSEVFTDALLQNDKIRPFAINFIRGLQAHFENDISQQADAQRSAASSQQAAVSNLEADLRRARHRVSELDTELERFAQEVQARGRALATRQTELERSRTDAAALRVQLNAANRLLETSRGEPNPGPSFWADKIPHCRAENCKSRPFAYNMDDRYTLVRCGRCGCKHFYNGY